jgi:hypothetical protein
LHAGVRDPAASASRLSPVHTEICPDLPRVDREVLGLNQRPYQELREEIATLKEKIKNLREERDGYRIGERNLARVMHVLTVENTNLRKEITKVPPSSVRTLPSRP